jgi:hypothetical protein
LFSFYSKGEAWGKNIPLDTASSEGRYRSHRVAGLVEHKEHAEPATQFLTVEESV